MHPSTDTVEGSRSEPTVVVAGGTTGLGRAVALDRVRTGHRVVVIGRDRRRLADLEAEVSGEAGTGRLHVIAADLSLVAETRRAIAGIRTITSRVDALVLCARHFHSVRTVTAEGFEHTFALLYLSRFVLSHELLDLLVASPRPVILNVAGPGSGLDDIAWDDLGGERSYTGSGALTQGGALNDLLGLELAPAAPRRR